MGVYRKLYVFGIVLLIFINIEVLAKFNLQHTFISGQNINCSKCHPEEAGNLSISVYHSNLDCNSCHNTTFYQNIQTHAATTINCTDCHENIENEITNEDEAHRALYLYAREFNLRRGANEACIMCHTTSYTVITYKYYDWINYTIYFNGTLGEVNPNTGIDEYYYYITQTSVGDYRTYYVEINQKDGSSHYWVNITNISCLTCHVNVKLGNFGNAQGSQHAGDVEDKGNPPDAAHLNITYGGATDAYCKSCHRNTSFNGYPHLNSSAVHAALKLQFGCLTCHNDTGPWPPANETPDKGGHYSEAFYPDVLRKVDRKLIGDFCTGCHRAYNHDIVTDSSGTNQCYRCHGSGGGTVGDIVQVVYTEPKAVEQTQWVLRTFP